MDLEEGKSGLSARCQMGHWIVKLWEVKSCTNISHRACNQQEMHGRNSDAAAAILVLHPATQQSGVHVFTCLILDERWFLKEYGSCNCGLLDVTWVRACSKDPSSP